MPRRIRKPAPTPSVQQIKVAIEKYHGIDVTHEADPSDKWDKDDISHSYTFLGFKVVPDGKYWDFILSEPPTNPMYFVYAYYNTGDSFHREDGLLHEIFLTPYYKDADTIKTALEKNAKHSSENVNPIKVYLPVAKKWETFSTSFWKGYFDSLDGFYIDSLNQKG